MRGLSGRVAMLLVCAAVGWMGGAPEAKAELITLDHINRGMIDSNGIHQAGWGRSVVGRSNTQLFRTFFVFDLAAILEGNVASATLRLETVLFFGAGMVDDGSGEIGQEQPIALQIAGEEINIYDVAALEIPLLTVGRMAANPTGQGLFNSLGSGVEFASRIFTSADGGQIVEIELNAAALAAIQNSLGGKFAVGVSSSSWTAAPPPTLDALFFGVGTEARTHQLVLEMEDPELVPVPPAAAAGFLVLGGLGLWRRLRGTA